MLSSNPAGSQNLPAFSGLIVQKGSSVPIAGATLTIAGHPGTVKTDADGRFEWEAPPTPPFQLIVILPGGLVAKPITVERLPEPWSTIHIDAIAEESVTVVGAAPSIAIAPAAGTTLLSRIQIARGSPESLSQALETIPGVGQISEGHAAVPAIRGMARGRTLMLIDGARVSSERRAGPSGTFADPAAFDGIDVARGPGSVAYGSDALGGVISVRTRRAEPGSPLRVRASGTFGAGIPERRASVEVGKGLATGGVLFQAHLRQADDWDSPVDDTKIFNSGWKDRGFLARFDHRFGPGLFSAGWQSDFARDVERPRNNSRIVRFYNPYEDSHRFTTAYELGNVRGFQQVSVTGFLGTSEQRTDQDRFAAPTAARGIDRADIAANDFHVKGSAVRVMGPARVEMGVDVNGRYSLQALETAIQYDTAANIISDVRSVSIEDAGRTDVGGYVQADAPVNRLVRLSGGVRGDNVTTKNLGGFFGDRTTSNGSFSGFGSATAGPFSSFTLTAQVSRGFRDPTLSDRYFRGPSGRGFITGNPDLRPETSLQFDMAARYARPRTQLAAYFYQYRINDLIERYETDTDFFFFRNRGRARLRGFEVEARTEIGRGYSIEVGAQVGRGVALDEDASLDDISPDTLSLLGRKNFGERGYAQVRAAFQADDDRPGPSEVLAPAVTLIDLGGGWSFTRHLELRGTIRNLLDESSYASPDPRWGYAPGRSATMTLAVQF